MRVLSRDAGRLTAHPADVPVEPGVPVVLRAELDGPVLRFGHDLNGEPRWQPFEPDATIMSDEHADEHEHGRPRVLGFTGAMLGLWVQDLDGGGAVAGFSWASYTVRS